MVRATGKGVVRVLLEKVGEVPGGGYQPESSGRKLPLLFFVGGIFYYCEGEI